MYRSHPLLLTTGGNTNNLTYSGFNSFMKTTQVILQENISEIIVLLHF